MENNLSLYARAEHDNQRYPKKWQAMLAVFLQWPAAYAVVMAFYAAFGVNYSRLFASEFGADMFNGIVSQFFAVMIVPLFMLSVTKKDAASTLRMRKKVDFVQILALLIMSVGVFFVAQTLNSIVVTSLSQIFGEPSDAGKMADAQNGVQLLFSIAVICALPALGEEMLFRGYCLRAFERTSTAAAILMSSMLFSIMHGNAQQMFYAFVVGILLAVVTINSDCLFAGATVHFTLNLISVVLTYPPVYEKYEYFVEKYSTVYSAFVMTVSPAILAGGLVLFLLYTKKKNRRLYGKGYVSDMAYPQLMKKESGGQKAMGIIFFVLFLLINICSAIAQWRGI